MGQRLKEFFKAKGIFLILMVGLALRWQGITNPYLDDQGWRQSDTASMALNMQGYLGDFPDVFFPMLNYDGMGPMPVELEFPFLPYLLAWTWTWLGWEDLWGRLWAILFSLLTVGGVYQLAKMTLSEKAGLWAAAFYAFFPLTTYYGRVVMPEPVAQAFTIGALIAIYAWRGKPTLIRLLGASLLMAGAILGKLPQLMIFPVALILGFYPFRGKNWQCLLYSSLSLLFPMLYYTWVHLGAREESQFVSGILSYQVLEGQNSFAQILFRNLGVGMGYPVLLALTGLVLIILKLFSIPNHHCFGQHHAKREVHLAFLLWAVISLGYLIVICLRIPLDYYLVPVAMPVALLAASALSDWKGTPSFVVGILTISLLWANQFLHYGPKYNWDRGILTQAEWIRHHTEKDNVLILSGSPPMTLYYSQRYGYRLINSDDEQAWQDLLTLPGDYLVALPNSRGEEFWKQVGERFPQVGPGVYDLKKS